MPGRARVNRRHAHGVDRRRLAREAQRVRPLQAVNEGRETSRLTQEALAASAGGPRCSRAMSASAPAPPRTAAPASAAARRRPVQGLAVQSRNRPRPHARADAPAAGPMTRRPRQGAATDPGRPPRRQAGIRKPESSRLRGRAAMASMPIRTSSLLRLTPRAAPGWGPAARRAAPDSCRTPGRLRLQCRTPAP